MAIAGLTLLRLDPVDKQAVHQRTKIALRPNEGGAGIGVKVAVDVYGGRHEIRVFRLCPGGSRRPSAFFYLGHLDIQFIQTFKKLNKK